MHTTISARMFISTVCIKPLNTRSIFLAWCVWRRSVRDFCGVDPVCWDPGSIFLDASGSWMCRWPTAGHELLFQFKASVHFWGRENREVSCIDHFRESKNYLKKLIWFLCLFVRSVTQGAPGYGRSWQIKFTSPIFRAEVGKGERMVELAICSVWQRLTSSKCFCSYSS